MAEMLIDGAKLDACLDAEADAIRAKTGGTDPIPYDYANNKGFADAIAAIPSGTTITDGIVVKARNSDGFATEIDYYGTTVPQYWMGIVRTDVYYAFSYLKTVNFQSNITEVGANAFYVAGRYASHTTADLSTIYISANSIGSSAFRYCAIFKEIVADCTVETQNTFANVVNLQTLRLPKMQRWVENRTDRSFLRNCTDLTQLDVGSVGFGITNSVPNMFYGCTNPALVVTAFCLGDYVDTLLPNIRNGATNATIIIKASEATTYNGTSYAAGDTILTSEVTA